MASHIIDIGDEKGNSFEMCLEVSYWYYPTGSWRTLDKGYIRFNSGWTKKTKSEGTLVGTHLLLFSSANTWGIRLNDFSDAGGANDQGSGIILQPWVLSFESGRISWALY